METRLKDYPCFYFTSAKGSRNEQKKYYATVAAMLGYSPKEAAESSGYFIAISKGKLFNSQPFSEEELATCNKIFETATSCTANLNRRFGVTKKVASSCCVLCPLSATYTNGRIFDEFIYLKGIIENPQYLKQYPLEPSLLKAMHSLTLDNDTGTYPVIPFNALLLEHLKAVDNPKQENLETELCSIIKLYLNTQNEMDIILDSIISSFVTTTLMQIMRSTKDTVSEQLLRAKHLELISKYTYTPKRNVFPATQDLKKENRHERKKKATALSDQIGFEMYIPSPDYPSPDANLLDSEKTSIMQEQNKTQIDDVSFSDIGATEDIFWKFLDMTEQEISNIPISSQNEINAKNIDFSK